MSELLRVNNLKVSYRTPLGRVKAVDGVTFSVKRKEILCIVGESGSGKSTLANGILKIVSPPCFIDGGEVLFNDIDILNIDEEKLRELRLKSISYIPQSSMNALNPVMKVRDQVIDGVMAHEQISKGEASKRVPGLMELVGLPPEAEKMYPHELSGGMRQRAIIAIAMALRPEFIIADEPTTALDVVVQRVILQFLVDLKEKYGSSLMIITHDMSIPAETCDRIAIMYAGKIMELAPVDEIFKNPLHPYTSALIWATPSLSKNKSDRLKGLSGLPPSLLNPPTGCRFAERCPYAEKRCVSEDSSLIEIKTGHFVACFKYS
jgi:peptide/nickel transport system ATP-binding protein